LQEVVTQALQHEFKNWYSLCLKAERLFLELPFGIGQKKCPQAQSKIPLSFYEKGIVRGNRLGKKLRRGLRDCVCQVWAVTSFDSAAGFHHRKLKKKPDSL
jgi:hypothetical protein